MIDFGFDKLALIGAVALVVIGPERLPRVARTVGHFIGKAQRYVADVKAEVNRSIELEELKKMKGEFEDAARNVERSVDGEIRQTSSHFDDLWKDPAHSATGTASDRDASTDTGWVPPPPVYRHPEARNGASSAGPRRSGTSSATRCAPRRSRARPGWRASDRRRHAADSRRRSRHR